MRGVVAPAPPPRRAPPASATRRLLDTPPSRHGDLECFLDLFYRRTGIRFPQHKMPLVERRATRAMREAGQPSFSVGVAHLMGHPKDPLMQQVVNALTINETYFYRELDQLKLLGSAILPLVDRKVGPVRVLSLPCSTGEEPYSIAIHGRENLPADMAARLQVIGADIDSNAIGQAQRATYGARAVGRLPPGVVQRYFRKTPDGLFELDRGIVRRVKFECANLLDPSITRQFRMIDVVFCRNVLIYFDDSAKRTALAHLHSILRPGGVLLLGHAEQIARLDVPFETRRVGGAQIHLRT